MLRQFIALIVTLAAAYVVYRFLNAHLGPAGLCVVLGFGQLIAWIASRLVIGLLTEMHDAAHYAAYIDVQGTHYAFDARMVRFYLVNDAVWIAASDVMPILQPQPDKRELRLLGKGYAPIPQQGIKGFSEDSLMRMTVQRASSRHAARDAVRFKLWLEKEALPNVKRLPSSYTARVGTAEQVRK